MKRIALFVFLIIMVLPVYPQYRESFKRIEDLKRENCAIIKSLNIQEKEIDLVFEYAKATIEVLNLKIKSLKELKKEQMPEWEVKIFTDPRLSTDSMTKKIFEKYGFDPGCNFNLYHYKKYNGEIKKISLSDSTYFVHTAGLANFDFDSFYPRFHSIKIYMGDDVIMFRAVYLHRYFSDLVIDSKLESVFFNNKKIYTYKDYDVETHNWWRRKMRKIDLAVLRDGIRYQSEVKRLIEIYYRNKSQIKKIFKNLK